ncbi:MAG: hypothetical protein KF690_01650 [Bacteroidetes bacterium]|nr:hypothetical protein [Bacteroidota bacterium]
MKRLLVAILCMSGLVRAQDNVQSTIILMQPDGLMGFNMEAETVGTWLGQVNETAQAHVKTLKNKGQVLIGLQITPSSTCTYKLATDMPEMDEKRQAALLKDLQQLETVYTKAANEEIVLVLTVNNGSDKGRPKLMLKLALSSQELQNTFSNGTVAQKKAALRTRCIQYLAPLLLANASTADAKFQGVQSTGMYYRQHQEDLGNIEKLYADIRIWRGMMEMSPRNYLIMVLFPMSHIIEGNLDAAYLQLKLMQATAGEKNLAKEVINDLCKYIDAIRDPQEEQVEKGIALHDAGKYAESIKVYDQVLIEDPYMSWAWHEMALSRSALQGKTSNTEQIWADVAPKLYKANPMYPYQMTANTGEQAYTTFRRLELKDLFQDSKKLSQDLYTYAFIAMELKNYGVAAQFFWLHITFSKNKDAHAFDYMLYCIDKCGADTQDLLKEEARQKFPEIEKTIRQKMVDSPLYNTMKDK